MGTIAKDSKLIRPLLLGVTALCLLAISSIANADEVKYLYDQTGRLDRVLKGTEALKYQYDEVGNLPL